MQNAIIAIIYIAISGPVGAIKNAIRAGNIISVTVSTISGIDQTICHLIERDTKPDIAPHAKANIMDLRIII
jgi:hypothetical protein